MAYTYRNVKTKEVITTSNKIHGKNWENVDEHKQHFEEAAELEGTFQEDTAEDEDETVTEEEAEAKEPTKEKPKRTRRGNK